MHSTALYLFESSYIIDVFSFNDETQNDSMLEEESSSDCDSDEEVSDPFKNEKVQEPQKKSCEMLQFGILSSGYVMASWTEITGRRNSP